MSSPQLSFFALALEVFYQAIRIVSVDPTSEYLNTTPPEPYQDKSIMNVECVGIRKA